MKELDGEMITFNTHKGKQEVARSQIAFVKADQKSLDFYTELGVFTELRVSLKQLEARWGSDWIRVHRNAFVSKAAVQSFNSIGRKLAVSWKGELAVLNVSRRQKAGLRRWLKTLKGVQP
jgi:DNA-binding LytR/AlgR family response regulator